MLARLPITLIYFLRELHATAHPPEHVAPERHLTRRQYEQTLLRRKLVAHHARVSLNARRVLPARREDNQRRAVLVPLVAAQTETHLNYLVPRRRLAVRNAFVVIRLRKHHVVLANLRNQTPVILALHAFIRALGNIKFLAARLVARFPEILHLVALVARETALPAAANLFHSRYLVPRLAQHYVAAHVAQLPYLELQKRRNLPHQQLVNLHSPAAPVLLYRNARARRTAHEIGTLQQTQHYLRRLRHFQPARLRARRFHQRGSHLRQRSLSAFVYAVAAYLQPPGQRRHTRHRYRLLERYVPFHHIVLQPAHEHLPHLAVLCQRLCLVRRSGRVRIPGFRLLRHGLRVRHVRYGYIPVVRHAYLV